MNLVEELSLALGVGTREILGLIATAPRRYKVYPIDKRNGGKRIIAQPSSELKEAQRFVLKNYLCMMPVHEAAKAYVSDANIYDNAISHARSEYILKLDFKEFFPSIVVADLVQVIKSRQLPYDKALQWQLAQILFWGRGSAVPTCLSIGAPSSPALSNIVMYNIDAHLSELAHKMNVIYTRYADDITISSLSKESAVKFEVAARQYIGKIKSPKLIFNDEKRGLYGRGQRRMVTGLVITPDHKVSIGRERKRLISSMIHKASLGELDANNTLNLQGLLGFCLASEPSFVESMKDKYGQGFVTKLIKTRVERPKS